MLIKMKISFVLIIFLNVTIFAITESSEALVQGVKKISYKKLCTLKGHRDIVQSLKILKNELLISGSADSTIRIWNMDGVCVKKFYNNTGWINEVEELENGLVACISNASVINFWNINKGKCTSLPNLEKNHVYGNFVIQLKNDNIAFSLLNHVIKFWDIKKDVCTKTIDTKQHAAWISSLIELKNSNYIATSSWDSTIKIWDISGETSKCIRTLVGHTDCVNTVVQVNDKILASAADDKMIMIWNIDYDDVNAVFSGHDDKVYALIVANEKIISGSRDKTVKVWNLESKDCLLTIPCEDKIYSLAFSNNKQYLFVGLGCGDIEVFQIFF
jgi:predicted NACHT family NTPase